MATPHSTPLHTRSPATTHPLERMTPASTNPPPFLLRTDHPTTPLHHAHTSTPRLQNQPDTSAIASFLPIHHHSSLPPHQNNPPTSHNPTMHLPLLAPLILLPLSLSLPQSPTATCPTPSSPSCAYLCATAHGTVCASTAFDPTFNCTACPTTTPAENYCPIDGPPCPSTFKPCCAFICETAHGGVCAGEVVEGGVCRACGGEGGN